MQGGEGGGDSTFPAVHLALTNAYIGGLCSCCGKLTASRNLSSAAIFASPTADSGAFLNLGEFDPKDFSQSSSDLAAVAVAAAAARALQLWSRSNLCLHHPKRVSDGEEWGVRVCACVCARARVRVCVCVCTALTSSKTFFCIWRRALQLQQPPPCSPCSQPTSTLPPAQKQQLQLPRLQRAGSRVKCGCQRRHWGLCRGRRGGAVGRGGS